MSRPPATTSPRWAWQPASLIAAESGAIMRGMLQRGFTTVRDAAGADAGLQTAQQKGLFEGPRLYIAGFPICQTGGHADMRPRAVRQRDWFCSCAGLGLLGAIADGVGEVRRAVREQVRTGANQIKIMAGGGISSPADPLEGTQFALMSCAPPARRPRPPTSMPWPTPTRRARSPAPSRPVCARSSTATCSTKPAHAS
ncbi:amidohydrolase family protein [Paucibacter sp. O1-1]|nr:amidohydrolase family protein [Paucibacter sp. O1-1]MDA3829922.1 amidohydrolase family protein [Paucibacter sp. O1-1]